MGNSKEHTDTSSTTNTGHAKTKFYSLLDKMPLWLVKFLFFAVAFLFGGYGLSTLAASIGINWGMSHAINFLFGIWISALCISLLIKLTKD